LHTRIPSEEGFFPPTPAIELAAIELELAAIELELVVTELELESIELEVLGLELAAFPGTSSEFAAAGRFSRLALLPLEVALLMTSSGMVPDFSM